MKMTSKRKTCLLMIVALLCLFALVSAFCMMGRQIVNAETSENENYNFTLITDEDGNESYQVSLKPVKRPTIEVAVVPNTFNGLPVTEIANNGFISCAKLNKVVLPLSLVKIGSNAFMNCAQLESIGLSRVETIGANAFAMCPKLDRLFIPRTVTAIGANALRNNANTIYVQKTQTEIDSEWDPTWKNYFTGEIIFEARPEYLLRYREILSQDGTAVVGYELIEDLNINAPDEDLTIYNTVYNEDLGVYLPLLNVCPNSFTLSMTHSIIFKDRSVDDSSFTPATHTLNIRSNAFEAYFGEEIRFEVAVSFYHPQGLETGRTESIFDGMPIIGDDDGNSVRVFSNASISSVTLPMNMDKIGQEMFQDCPYLTSIKIYGQEYNKFNPLPQVSKIGDKAFNGCISLEYLSIPASVLTMGSAVFANWGTGDSLESQTIFIDQYDDEIPSNWALDWDSDISFDSVTIQYKALTEIVVNMNDGLGTTVSVALKPGRVVPDMVFPGREGYTFKGVFAEPEGKGYQYYTDNMQGSRVWNEGDPMTLYANWTPINYTITYVGGEGAVNPNPIKYTIEDEIVFAELIRDGYHMSWNPSQIEKGTMGDITVVASWTPTDYSIEYIVDFKGLNNPNPEEYTIEDEVVFENLEKEGYTFSWDISGIPKGTTGNITVVGTWTPNTYNINYSVWEGTTINNPSTYTYDPDDDFILTSATYGGYYVTWSQDKILAGTIGDVTISASYVEKTLNQSYNNGVYEIWTKNQFLQLKDELDGGRNRTYKLMANLQIGAEYMSYTLTPIDEFNGVFDGNGHSVTLCKLNVSSGGNLGLFRINNGTIKNLTLGIGYDIDNTYSNVNVGTFAGINKGAIENCGVNFPGSDYRCYAGGDSNAGIYVGVNEGIIKGANDRIHSGMRMYGSCNMGVIAGKNSGEIMDCDAGNGNTKIDYQFDGTVNACVGGIAGLQTKGEIKNCSFQGQIIWLIKDLQGNRVVQPCIGIILGYKQDGTCSGSDWKPLSGLPEDSAIVDSIGEPEVVTWTTGALWWTETHTHNQGLYFKNEECGRID